MLPYLFDHLYIVEVKVECHMYVAVMNSNYESVQEVEKVSFETYSTRVLYQLVAYTVIFVITLSF